ncbi:hypothetical protein RN001_011700 [Aquatica leii]|uniref:Cuticle protein 6 n=1 Tax=Aquatica leii TaxID=1421715 RepID=A0AAN7SM49_9COLE|nr:hypothetical protein RN001_011700 [Aquatica leii]
MRVLETEAHKMKLLYFVITLLLLWDVSCSGVTIGITPYSHPIQSLYHSQDVLGQYAYGYSTPTSSKSESRTADGVTQGGYSYLDSNGFLQTVKYFSDPIHGFRVLATNLPQDLPEVAHAKAEHLLQFQATQAERAAIAAKITSGSAVIHIAPVQDLPEVARAKAQHLLQFQATQAEHAAIAAKHLSAPSTLPVKPVHLQDLPEVVKARAEHLAAFETTKARDISLGVHQAVHIPNVAYSYVPAVAIHTPVSSQYHSQDNLGQYSYGYVNPLSSKSELKTADGVTRGGYSYIDANGIVQTINYVADSVHGFRVVGTNLPAAPQILLKGATTSSRLVETLNPLAKPVLYVHNLHY